VHYQDVALMPERDQIERELRQNRDEHLKLIESQLPEIGNCTFADYFTAAIGPTLYQKSMANYTWKMWNIPGDELETRMVWADRFESEKGAPTTQKVTGYDPLKFDDHTLGKGIKFQVYPQHGWNAVWDAMVSRATVVRDRIVGIQDEHRQPYVLTESGEKYHFSGYHTVFCSIEIDRLWNEDALPYTGRMMIPLVIPGLPHAFPEGAESLHYSSREFQTRVTKMKVITRHELHPLVAHVHLKGYEQGGFCEFGVGDVDLTPVLRVLIAGGYRGGLTVEYEGPFDRTLRLYESVRRARLAIDELRRDGAVIADEPASRDSRAV
jgi:hypothetical protein